MLDNHGGTKRKINNETKTDCAWALNGLGAGEQVDVSCKGESSESPV